MHSFQRLLVSNVVILGLVNMGSAQIAAPSQPAVPAQPLTQPKAVALPKADTIKELRAEDELTDNDAKDAGKKFFKSYQYKMEAGKHYRIDLVTKTEGLDPYLRLEDPNGKVVAQDDDGGGFPNARIYYKATVSGDHKIICTTFAANMFGKFSLTVLGSSDAEIKQARNPVAPQPIPGKAPFPDAPTTHKQTAEVKVRSTDGKYALQTIGMDADGNVLCLAAAPKSFGAPVKNTVSEVLVYSKEGKLLRSMTANFHGNSVTGGPDGSVYVAGDGKVAKFDKTGKQIAIIELPHMKEILSDTAGIRKKAEDQIKMQRDNFAKTVQQFKDRVKTLEEKKEADRTDLEKRQLTQFHQILKSYEQTEKFYASQTVDSVVEQMTSRVRTINAITFSAKDVFFATGDTKGFGYSIWRADHDFKNAKQVLTGIGGCCGQMDIQTVGDDLLVAENTKHRFARYSREGKAVGAWGKRGTGNELECFGGCCNPMNVCSTGAGDIFTAESEGIVKRFSSKGDYLGVVATASLSGGCKNVAVCVTPKEDRLYFLDLPGSRVLIFSKKSEK
jgi:hypothetical protein